MGVLRRITRPARDPQRERVEGNIATLPKGIRQLAYEHPFIFWGVTLGIGIPLTHWWEKKELELENLKRIARNPEGDF